MKRRWLRQSPVFLTRLSREGRSLLAMASAALFVAADVGRTDAHLLVLGIVALLAASLLFTRAYRLTDVTAELMVPRRVTVGEEIAIAVTLRNGGVRTHRDIRVDLPWLGRAARLGAPAPDIDHLAPGQLQSTVVRARFGVRGHQRLAPLRVAAVLPWGLAQGAALVTASAQFAVVPRVASVVSVRTPENRRHQPGGVALASRTGDATELLGVRPYRPGDAVRDLHARSWARHGAPMVREYQETFFTRIGVVVDSDVSNTSAAHFEAALSLAAGVVARLSAGEALVDLLLVGSPIQKVSLGRSVGSLELALDALAGVSAGPAMIASRVLAELAPHLDRLSSVVFVALTDDEPRAALVSGIRARGVPCMMVLVGDAARRSIASTTVALASIERGEPIGL